MAERIKDIGRYSTLNELRTYPTLPLRPIKNPRSQLEILLNENIKRANMGQ